MLFLLTHQRGVNIPERKEDPGEEEIPRESNKFKNYNQQIKRIIICSFY
jgi:hypothetical protein